jgi:hypothetical protein
MLDRYAKLRPRTARQVLDLVVRAKAFFEFGDRLFSFNDERADRGRRLPRLRYAGRGYEYCEND